MEEEPVCTCDPLGWITMGVTELKNHLQSAKDGADVDILLVEILANCETEDVED